MGENAGARVDQTGAYAKESTAAGLLRQPRLTTNAGGAESVALYITGINSSTEVLLGEGIHTGVHVHDFPELKCQLGLVANLQIKMLDAEESRQADAGLDKTQPKAS